MKTVTKNIFIALMIVLAMSSCKKDEIMGNTKQVLDFHWHSKIGTQDAKYGVEYTTKGGVKFELTDWRYYVSNFVLIKDDGTEYKVADKVFLINIANADYSLDSVPVGKYKGFKFYVGLDSVTNHLDPTLYAAGNPLALQNPPIHWSWNAGYIFFKVETLFDDSEDGTGSPDTESFHHVGTDNLKRTISLMEPFEIKSGSDKTIHLQMDLLEVFKDVNLKTESVTHSFGPEAAIAKKIADDWQSAFSLD